MPFDPLLRGVYDADDTVRMLEDFEEDEDLDLSDLGLVTLYALPDLSFLP